jgi:2-C-methyl-D-erythritol 4-phosphate cytidylyltransferase
MKGPGNLFVSVIVAAAGRGSRMNMPINKLYMEIGDVPVLVRTLTAFQDCRLVNEIILVVNNEDILFCKQDIIDPYRLYKVKTITAGGSERQMSVYNGLLQVNTKADIVMIHDGARPFIDEQGIARCVETAAEFGACTLAVRVKDTIKKADDDGTVTQTVDRRNLWAIQTPQAFKYGLIMEAHERARQDGFTGTDDTVLVERIGKPVKLVEGSYRNIKITTREDLIIAEGIVCADYKAYG